MRQLLEEVRRNLGSPPRKIGLLTRWKLYVKMPPWAYRDELNVVFRSFWQILREGNVVWGALVQANSQLFEPGSNDCPAQCVYSPDPQFDDRPADLQVIANRLFALKNSQPTDPEEQRVAAMITDEMDRKMGWSVPSRLSGGRDVRSATIMVFRIHLPGGVLHSGWFPLLIHPSVPVCLIVPGIYWPPQLAHLWIKG